MNLLEELTLNYNLKFIQLECRIYKCNRSALYIHCYC